MAETVGNDSGNSPKRASARWRNLRGYLIEKWVRSRAPADPPVTRGGQFVYMFFITLIGTLVVTIFEDRAPSHAIPAAFWLIELAVLAVCGVGSFDTVVDRAQRGTFVGESDAAANFPNWKRLRNTYGHWFIQAGVVLNMVALWIAITHTGGAQDSPFAPMLAGPAIFGAFVAQTKGGIGQIVIGAVLATLVVDRFLHGRVEGRQWVAYWVPQAALLVGAGIISVGVLWRDETLRKRRRPPGVADFDEEALRNLGLQVVLTVLQIAGKPSEDGPPEGRSTPPSG